MKVILTLFTLVNVAIVPQYQALFQLNFMLSYFYLKVSLKVPKFEVFLKVIRGISSKVFITQKLRNNALRKKS